MSNYTYNTDWDTYAPTSMLSLLKTPYYQNVLKMPFETYIFEAHDFDTSEGGITADWMDGMSEEEKAATQQQVYEVAKYLMQNFSASARILSCRTGKATT